MTQLWSISKRELKSYFVSPIAYIILGIYLLMCGRFFVVVYTQAAPYATVYHIVSFMTSIFMFLSPMLTMRLLSEEKKQGTLELLYTSPISVTGIVLGKYLGSILFFLILFGLTLQFPIFLMAFGRPDLLPLLANELGFILFGCTLLSIGMFASSLAENQVVSAIVGFALVIFFWIIQLFTNTSTGPVANWLASLSMGKHLESFNKGIIDAGDIFFFLAMSFMFVFLTIRRLEWKRW